ncbi:MAG: primosomal protein N' [Bacilli bacterium]|nr:primosomal protein N' [Bacilli bacterium]
MFLVNVLIEIKANHLNRPFTYIYNLNRVIKIGIRVVVPFQKRSVIGYVIGLKNYEGNIKTYEKKTGFNVLPIIDVLDDVPILNKELFDLSKEIADYYLCPTISVLQTMLPASLRPNSASLRAPKISYEKYLIINKNVNQSLFKLTPKQLFVLDLINKSEKIQKNKVKQNSVIKKLLQLDLIKEISVEKKRIKQIIDFNFENKKKELTEEQNQAINNILSSSNNVTLLEGVTGSGKTEIYLSISKKVISSGKSVLVLVPEIFLVEPMVRYFKRDFNEIAIFHSGLTPAEKYDEYRYIASGNIKIVIGTRSAIFAPLSNIGLIILDEEHSDSYKNNKTPFYDAHKIALMRSKKNNNALVIFGSATPLLETRIKAEKGIFNYVKLSKRVNSLPLPKTYIVEIQKQQELSIISDFLYTKIKEKILNKEQIILLMNRRGFSTSVVCNECHKFLKCLKCGVLLAFHKSENILKCHNCGSYVSIPTFCDNCSSKDFVKLGIGIEKIEESLKAKFPNSSIARLDSDINNNAKSRIANKIIRDFYDKKIDILLGTQMIAKSYDFPNVTLAAIILADIGFSLPSFKKNENIFSLITQTIGRSGRSNKIGEAVIQTFSPEYYVIKQACKQNYNAFFKEEMHVRKINQFPPYVYIIVMTIRGKNENAVCNVSKQIFNELVEKNFKDTTILQPVIPHIPLENKKYLRKIIIKYKKDNSVKEYIKKNIVDSFNKNMSVFLSVDVDSVDF